MTSEVSSWSPAWPRLLRWDVLAGCFAAVIALGIASGSMAGYALSDPAMRTAGQCRPFTAILGNNVGVLGVVVVLAVVSIGVVAGLYLLYVFWIVGFQIGQSVAVSGWGFTVDGLIWHLPIEPLAFIVASAGAGRSGWALWAMLTQRDPSRRPAFLRAVLAALVTVVIAVALLGLAAAIEATISKQC